MGGPNFPGLKRPPGFLNPVGPPNLKGVSPKEGFPVKLPRIECGWKF